MSGSSQFVDKRLRFSFGWRVIAVFVGFPCAVNAIRLAWWMHRMAGESVVPPHRLLTARIMLAVLLSIVGFCLYVWSGRRRLRIAFDEARGELVIRLRGLFRTRLRRIGLAGFSLMRTGYRRRRFWFGVDRIVIEFADGHIEPIVDLSLADADAGAQVNSICDAVFTMARRLKQAPAHVSIRAALQRDERDQESLAHELVVDGKNLAADAFGPLDLVRLEQSLVADGNYFIWSCECGEAGCSGRFDGVQVRHHGDEVEWRDHDVRRRYTFRRTELRSAFDKTIADARELRRQKPQMVLVPMQNEAVIERHE